MQKLNPLALAAAVVCAPAAWADEPAAGKQVTLPAVTVRASADASAAGLSSEYPGGQVARGGRAGILGTRDNMETPFSITSYTNELIQDQQAKSVGEVLQNDPTVRVARGFGNFQQSYFIRGFILNSDDVAFNGLYSLLPRQYIATELFERVEVLRGASAFLNGANPSGGGIGGTVNLLPKRAPREPLNRVTTSAGSGGQGGVAADIARRFGTDGSTGVRINAAYRGGGTAVNDEKATLGLAAVGLDWRSSSVRLSGDLGLQENRLRRTRPSVTLGGVVNVPAAPENTTNFAQPWSFSNERDLFGTIRAEWDIGPDVTGWGAYGLRRSDEANSLANLTVSNAGNGAGSTSRFDNTREDKVDTGELGLRGKLRSGQIGHEWTVAASWFKSERKNAFAFDLTQLPTNLYTPTSSARPEFGASTFFGGSLDTPNLTGRTRLSSLAFGDTLALFDDSLLLTLGLRHQRLQVTDFAFGSGALTGDYQASRTSPAVGAVWRVSKQFSVYGNYIEGLTQGGTAPATSGGVPVANAGQALPPYVSKQKEVGLKVDAGRIGGGLSVFSTRRPRAVVNSSNLFSAEGFDRHAGVELNAFGEANRNVRVLGGVTWLNAKQERTGSVTTDGKRVIGVPKIQANLGTEWTVPGLRELTFDVRAVYTASSYADDANALRVPGWTRIDLGARYLLDLGGKLVTIRGRVDNVTNRNYWSSAGGYPGAGYLALAAPRTVTVSAAVDF